MSEKLKPCPFCGGEAIADCGFNYDYDGGNRYYAYSADVTCSCGCTLHVENSWPKEYVAGENMLDFAIAVWNTREERTCHNVSDAGFGFKCSECGDWEDMEHNPYCPHCGAKVVER